MQASNFGGEDAAEPAGETPAFRRECRANLAAWTAQRVNQVAKAKLWVQVTGQRFFDSSHSACQNGTPVKGDPARVSLWEIHPIYSFEVCPATDCTTGGWVPLEKWKP